MKSVFKKLVKLIPVTILAIATTFTVVNAASVGFSYEGWSIRSKESVNSAYVSAGSIIYADHYQSRDWPDVPGTLRVSIYKDNWWGDSLFHYEDFSGDGYFICGKCNVAESGTYYLQFNTTGNTQSYQAFYIKGNLMIE